MGRGIRYRRGPTAEQIAAARKAQEDAHYRRGLMQVTTIIIVNLLLTAGLYVNPHFNHQTLSAADSPGTHVPSPADRATQ